MLLPLPVARPLTPFPMRLLALLLALATLLAMLPLPALSPAPVLLPPTAPITFPPETIKSVWQLPLPVQYAFSRDVGRDNFAYHVRPVSASYVLDNPAQRLRAMIDGGALSVASDDARWDLALAGWGRPTAMRPLPEASAQHIAANRLDVSFGDLTAWYANGPLGLQQGWTLAQRPDGDGPLQLALRLGGDLQPAVSDDGRALELRDVNGAVRLRYGGLLAFDAAGQPAPVAFMLHGAALAITVDDAGAIYPLTIDPWVQTATLKVSEGNAAGISSDGRVIVIGTPETLIEVNRGAIYVYIRPKDGWTSSIGYRTRISAVDGTIGDGFGSSVAISNDGKTIAVGSPYHPGGNGTGAVYVYQSLINDWEGSSFSVAKITAADGQNGDKLGESLSLSGNGSVLVAGAYAAGGGYRRGALYVYSRPIQGWVGNANFGAKLTAFDAQDSEYMGSSVALSADGSTIVAGAFGRNAVYIYVRSGMNWVDSSMYTARITSSDSQSIDSFGQSVAVSANGDTVVAGAPVAIDQYKGAVYLYTRPFQGWRSTSTFTSKFTIPGGKDGDYFGWSVAVSANGDLVVAGSIGYYGGVFGALYGFIRPDEGWDNTNVIYTKFTDNYRRNGDNFGWFTAISADGALIATGVPDSTDGEVVIFQRPRFSLSASGTPSRTPTSGTFLLTRDLPQDDVTVQLNLTSSAIYGTQYSLAGGGVSVTGNIVTVKMISGTTSLPISLTPSPAAVIGQSVSLSLRADPEYVVNPDASSATLAIRPSVSIALAPAPSSAYPLLGTVTINRPTQETTDALPVTFQLGGDAALGQDYQVIGANLSGSSGSVTIPGGAQSASFELRLLQQASPASGRQVVISLTPSTTYAITGPPSVAIALDGQVPPPWLVLLYLAGDDSDPGQKSLTPYLQSLRARLKPNPNARIIVLYDGNERGDGRISVIDALGARDVTSQALGWPDWEGPVVPTTAGPELDTGSYLTLQSFIGWARTTYPGARHTMLSVVDHGGGWAPDFGGSGQPGGGGHAQAGGQRGLGIDHLSGKSLSTRDTGRVFAGLGSLGKLDVLFFDACLMGMVESAYEVQPYARYLVAGQNILWSRFPYDVYLSPENLNAATTPEALARTLVDRYNEPAPTDEPFTVAALDLQRLPQVVAQTNTLAQVLLAETLKPSSTITNTITRTYQLSQQFDYGVRYRIGSAEAYVDLYDFASWLVTNQDVPASVRQAAQGVRLAIGDGQGSGAVVAIKNSSGRYNGAIDWNLSGAHGLSIYLPLGERDCRPTGTYQAGQPTVIAPCTKPTTVPGQPQAEPQLQRYYSKGGQLAFTEAAPAWRDLLLQLDAVVPASAPEYGAVQPGPVDFDVFLTTLAR